MLALAAALAGVAAGSAGAFYQRYVNSGYFGPGSSAASTWNGLTFNATSFVGGSYTMGTRYQRTDASTTSWLWSSTGSIFDSRSIAYGRAICAAAPTNPGSMLIEFCDTGNG